MSGPSDRPSVRLIGVPSIPLSASLCVPRCPSVFLRVPPSARPCAQHELVLRGVLHTAEPFLASLAADLWAGYSSSPPTLGEARFATAAHPFCSSKRSFLNSVSTFLNPARQCAASASRAPHSNMLHVGNARALTVLPLEEACALVFGGVRGVCVDISGGVCVGCGCLQSMLV